jgi:iron complex outermembrane receptor protein
LGETLASEPGVQSTHFGAGASRPVIRGMDGPRVQVLSGGSAVQDASNVSPDHAVMADSMLAEQIEVLRGPSALLYGGAWAGW